MVIVVVSSIYSESHLVPFVACDNHLNHIPALLWPVVYQYHPYITILFLKSFLSDFIYFLKKFYFKINQN